MLTTMATATEMQNNFGHYLKMVLNGQQIIITRNGKEVARVVPREHAESYLTDSLTGILKGNDDADAARDERLREKYEKLSSRKHAITD